jgi:glycosyltransferase involved in cell wall biosynthesis
VARVLVGIPTRNRPDLVRETVRSVLSQTEPDFRIIVSDNASEAEASESVSRFIRDLADPRVCYYRQPENVGEYGQGRYFFEQCGEKYFVILHDDDRLEPDYLRVALNLMESHPEAACLAANAYIFDLEGAASPERTRRFLASHGRDRCPEGFIDILEPLLRCGFIPISGAFFRTSALRASGFVDEDCHGNYPFELNVFLRLGERNERAFFTARELIGFRHHDTSLRHTSPLKFNQQITENLLKLLERRRFTGTSERLRRKMLAFTSRNYAVIRLAMGDTAGCQRLLIRAIRLNPLSYRNWTYSAGAFTLPFLMRALYRSKVIPASPH